MDGRRLAWTAGLALVDADLRRRRNRLPGLRTLAPPARAVLALAVGVGLATVAALLWGIGSALGRVFPAGPEDGTVVSGACWSVAVVLVAGHLLSARPNQARLLLDPPDRAVLLSWRVPQQSVFLARLWLPALAGAVGSVVVAGLAAGPWLAASPAGRALLPAVLTAVAGSALAGALGHVAATAALMLGPRRALPLAALGVLLPGLFALGLVLGPLADRLHLSGRAEPEEYGAALRSAVARLRPDLWDRLLDPDRLGTALLGWCSALLLLGGLAHLLLRRAAARGALRPAVPGGPAAAAHTSGTLLDRVPPVLLPAAKDLLALRRRPVASTGALFRTALVGLALATLGAGVRLGHGGEPPWRLPLGAWSVPLALAVFLALSTVVAQVAGVEAEQRSLDLLRQAPVPFGRILAGKVASCCAVAAVPVVPLYLGLLLVGGGSVTAGALLALPVALLAGSCALVAAAFLTPAAEGFADGRAARSGATETVEGLLAAVLAAPAAAGPLLRSATGTGGAVEAAACLLDLALLLAVLRFAARSDLRIRKVRP
ncbi:hypothetical protein [Kitasatospora sp. NPDC056273]|uniref:hypothetical protein n=1 Tax=Kitasatospora sp. NPDC056273 TaxID=3345769 RepID=UPI0035DA66C5